MPSRRSLSFAILAAALLLASGLGGWLASDPGVAAPAARAKLGMPFRVVDGVWTQVTFAPSAEEGEQAALQPVLANAGDVIKLLNSRGFSDVTGVRHRGESFVCEATGPRRQRVRLVVDARSGEISGLQVLGPAEAP